jgi:outer membrane protein OmpA-like peptidoglycan-associated protein
VDLVLHPSAALSCTFSGLNNGTPYTATITASIAGGASITDAIIARPSSLGNVPSAPREVIFRGSTAGVATVTWKVSASNGGSPISRYVVFIKGTRFAKSCVVNVSSNPNAALRCTISGLKPKRFYSYRVAAFNGAGSGGTADVRRALDIDVRIASFARGKTTLWSGLARQASITAKYIKKFKFNKVVVTGYTNPNGTVASRIASTQARALTVANFINKRLKALGIKNVTVTAAGSGTALYRHPNAKQRKLNRSVSTYLSYN